MDKHSLIGKGLADTVQVCQLLVGDNELLQYRCGFEIELYGELVHSCLHMNKILMQTVVKSTSL